MGSWPTKLSRLRKGSDDTTTSTATAQGPAVCLPPPARVVVGLPAQPGRLIGRDADIEVALNQLIGGEVRLLTLVGPAGTGKTRLAVEVAEQAIGHFAHGAYFVDLSPVTDPALLETSIAQAMDVREQPGRSLIDILDAYLADQECLLLLDNFEQLVAAAPRLARLIQRCASLRLLVTSREPLRLRWEHVQQVEPLAVPTASTLPDLTTLAAVPAVELFVRRAERVNPRFRLSQSNARAVAAISVRLDGLPLAIELAAARTRLLTPEALLNRLGNRLELAAANQDQPPRQQTLRAALDWSYDLLSWSEQTLFRRLGVFVGGFGVAAVAEVCDPDGSLGVDPLMGVESLFDKSLLRLEHGPGEREDPRFGMLETVREYARERLAESGELDTMRQRHARYFLSGADVPLAEMKMSQQSMWLQSLESEFDNIVAALTWCEQGGEPDLGLTAAGLLAWFWIVRGYVAVGRAQLTALLSIGRPVRDGLRAEALRVVGSLALHQSDFRGAREYFHESLSIRRELGDQAGLLGALSGLGAVALQEGELATAEAHFGEALHIQTAIDDRLGVCESLNNLANVAHERGQLERARALYEQSLTLNRGVLRYRTDVVLHNLGVVAQEQGDLTTARSLFQDSVAIKRSLADSLGLALSLAKLGEVLAATGDLADAHRALAESLRLAADLGDRSSVAFVLERIAATAARHGSPERALRLASAAGGLRSAVGAPLGSAAKTKLNGLLERARASVGRRTADQVWAEGGSLSFDEAIAEALTLPDQAAAPTPDPAGPRLSVREREVAVLLAEGCTNREIADRLVVSERTAENHVQRVLNRLGLRSRAQVAAWAVRNGVVER